MRTADIVKITFGVLALITAGVLVVILNPFKPAVQLSNRVLLVDVETADVFQVDVSRRGIAPPLRNPDTGKLTLVPAAHDTENDRWYIPSRYLTILDRLEAKPVGIASPATGDFEPASTKPKTIEPAY